MNFKAVIFDMDGTLLDTLADIAESMNRVLEDYGFPTHHVDAYRYFVGGGAARLVQRALPEKQRNGALASDCLTVYKETYKENWNRKTRPYDGIPELLNALTDRRIHLAINTNKPQNFAELCVHEFLPGWNFAAIVGQRDDVPMKPDATGPHLITHELEVKAEECIYLGDSDVDIETAINSNMLPVGAEWGFRTESELLESGADRVINHPMDLMELIS